MNARLAQRVKQLEGGAGMGPDMPRFILVRGIAASEQTGKITTLVCDNETAYRHTGESESDFINRVEDYFEDRIKPGCVGMMFAKCEPTSEA